MSSRSSRSGGGAIQASARRPMRSRSTRSVASRSSFFTRRCPQLLPSGWARWTVAPHSWITSAAQYHPYVASNITSGCSPALASSAAKATGSLSMRTVSSVWPASLRRTITLRRRCRSMPTYCCCCSTGASFCRLRVGLGTPSVLCTPGPGRREDSRGLFDLGWAVAATFLAVTGSLLVLGVRTRCAKPVPVTRELRCAPSLHQDPNSGDFQARRIEPSLKGTTALGFLWVRE